MSTKKNIDDRTIFRDGYAYNHRISWYQKKKKDFEWAEKMADYYDYFFGHYSDRKKIDKYKMNYNLFNGRGEEAMQSYRNSNEFAELAIEGIEIGYENIQHHDIISHIAKAMVGEQKKRPLKPTAVDTSAGVLNQRKRKKLELMQQHLHQSIIAPMQDQIVQQYMQEMGIQDPYQLSPEQQQQMQADVAQRTEAMTPKEIKEYMRKDYKATSETEAQHLMDYLVKDLDIKFTTDEGFKHAIITGEEIYRVGVRHNNPFLELVNPLGFSGSGRPNEMFIENWDWAKYEQSIKYTDMFNQFGDQFENKHYKKLDSLYHIGGDGSTSNLISSELVSVVSRDNSIIESAPDIRTKEGQDFMKELYDSNGSLHLAHHNVRHVHLAWKSLRKLKHISRNMNGELKKFWVDESYEFNPLKGDVEEKTAWVPEVWETDKLGTVDAIYLNKRPLPYQYRSIHNPWDVKLPYYGTQYNRLMSNTKNVAPLDLGKPWQYKFNIQMARLHEMEATDLGKVLLTTFNAIPKDWTWGKFFQMMKYGKVAPLDLHQEGMNPVDAQLMKSVDLSNAADIASRIQYLEWLSNKVATAMSYNPSRLGQMSPYTAVTNNQQNIVQSSHQTEDVFSIHNKVLENVLNGVMNVSRIAFKDNPVKKTYLLDDMSIAELDLDWEMLHRSEIGIFVSNSSEDFQNVELVKSQAQSMIQNGLISFSELIRLTWAKNYGDVLNIAESAEERAEQKRQEAMQAQQEQMQMQAQMAERMKQMEQQFDLLKQERDHVNSQVLANVNVQQMALQHDIDNNQINDGIQKAQMEIESKEKLEKMKLEADAKKHKRDSELKEKEIDVKKIAARKKPSSSK